jgi:tetratricopeptide (TPR) repeat protein
LPKFDRLWDYDHPPETERKFRALLPAAEKSGDLSYLLELQTQIARCQGLAGKFDDCHATLDAVEKRLTGAVPVARVRYLLERGRAFNSSDHPDKAKPLFLEAWDQANAAGETGHAIDAAHMLAIVETDPGAQVDWNRRALAVIDKDPKQQGWLPAIYNNLGETYRAAKEYEKALDCFQKRAQWFGDRGKKPDMYTRKDIARMERLLGRTDAALAVIEPIARDLKAKNQADGYISAEYGQCLAAVGRAGEAKPFLVEAYERLSKDDYMVKYEPEELRHIKQLAGIGD